VSVVEFSVEVAAPPERVWEVTSDPRSLPRWDRRIEAVDVPASLGVGSRFRVVMGFLAVRATVRAEIVEWEPPVRARIRLEGPIRATVSTTIGALPEGRSLLRHEVAYAFAGPLGRIAAASLNAVGGAQLALRRGTLRQRDQIEGRRAGRAPARRRPAGL
jgi:uncharacterized protein YndB with AHSA1/START domain